MANVNSAQSEAMRRAIEHLRRGDGAEAEAVMQAHVRQVSDLHGAGGPKHQLALNELAIVLLNGGQVVRAVEAFRGACAGPLPDDEQDLRDRLTHLMNFGQALEMAGRFDEAEAAFRQGLEGRAKCYGRKHAGYGFGLEPLAVNLLRQGKLDAAATAIEETVQNFWKNGHPRVNTALATRAEIRAAAGATGSLFGDLNELPQHVIAEMANSVLARLGQAEPAVLRRVLEELVPLAEKRLGIEHPLFINALMARANLERSLGASGDAVARIGSIGRAIDLLDRLGREAEAINVRTGLALAQSDYGRFDEAETTYRDAEARARRLGEPAILAHVLRNLGLFLAEREHRDDAERTLFESIDRARESDNRELLGRCVIALGIFLQHGGRLDVAAGLLREGLTLLNPADPDAVTARSHLGAIESGSSCACGNPQAALEEALRAFILPRLPDGLVAQLDFAPDEAGHLQPAVALTREPTEDDMETLQRVIGHAMEEFRRKLGEVR